MRIGIDLGDAGGGNGGESVKPVRTGPKVGRNEPGHRQMKKPPGTCPGGFFIPAAVELN
jgi:hypothetical protein